MPGRRAVNEYGETAYEKFVRLFAAMQLDRLLIPDPWNESTHFM